MPLCITGILAAHGYTRGRVGIDRPAHGFGGPTRGPPVGGYGPTRTGYPRAVSMSKSIYVEREAEVATIP